MFFQTPLFIVFLAVTVCLFHISAIRFRAIILLVASIIFYTTMSAPYLLLALAWVALASYSFGLLMGRSESDRQKLWYLWLGIACNLGVLLLLKYLPPIARHIDPHINKFIGSNFLPVPESLITIGLAYFTVQAVSYLVDVYLELYAPERNFCHFTLYLCFFPKLLQGPIERAENLLPQLKSLNNPAYDDLRAGAIRFTWGLFVKVIIADRLGLYVDQVYGNVHNFDGFVFMLATYAYAFQIYFDFASYTDMALGVARAFGIRLSENFNRPYLATSVADFWRRWHITFSSCLLDYLFKPAQISLRKFKTLGVCAAILFTFILSGVWHGAKPTFIIWGLLHGLIMAVSVIYKPYENKLLKHFKIQKNKYVYYVQVLITFHLICFTWVFFRSSNISDACYVIFHFTSGASNVRGYFTNAGPYDGIILMVGIICLLTVNLFKKFKADRFTFFPSYVRLFLYTLLLLAILVFHFPSNQPFLYMGF